MLVAAFTRSKVPVATRRIDLVAEFMCSQSVFSFLHAGRVGFLINVLHSGTAFPFPVMLHSLLIANVVMSLKKHCKAGSSNPFIRAALRDSHDRSVSE